MKIRIIILFRTTTTRLQKKIKIFLIEYNNIKNKKHAKQNEKKNFNALFLIAKILKHFEFMFFDLK